MGMKASTPPLVSVVMGSESDLAVMEDARETLKALGVPHEVMLVSAHRTPDWMYEFAREAEGRGIQAIIAAAGGAAHLPGMIAALTQVPVLGVPISATALAGVDALLSIVQMPAGVPVATFAVGKAGAVNAALFAAEMLARQDLALRDRLLAYRQERRDAVLHTKVR
jgi:5-(carboxyamino)imidazole ribonucleotide mutase